MDKNISNNVFDCYIDTERFNCVIDNFFMVINRSIVVELTCYSNSDNDYVYVVTIHKTDVPEEVCQSVDDWSVVVENFKEVSTSYFNNREEATSFLAFLINELYRK